MDSLSQIALGSAVGMAVMGRRTALWKAALVGAVFGTLPDLDAFIDHGDPIRNMTFHRAESHAFFYLTLVSPMFAWLVAKMFGELQYFKHWLLAIWLILVTHALLDFMTIYGTQLALPFTDTPLGIGSVFIIDPLYTLPLLLGILFALILHRRNGVRWNNLGLGISCIYLVWSLAAQQVVKSVAQEVIAANGWPTEKILVTPTAFNTLLWRVLVLTPNGYAEGFYSVLDNTPAGQPRIQLSEYQRGEELLPLVQGNWEAERVIWFSRGFYKLREQDDKLIISDLRMGQEPFYSFNFTLAQRTANKWEFIKPEHKTERPDISVALDWIWLRIGDEKAAPPWL